MEYTFEEAVQIIRTAEKGKKDINISDLAGVFGITAETLRKYEKLGIIAPFRETNSYRNYSSWELTKVICARQFRAEGYSLKEIAGKLDGSDGKSPGEHIARLEEQLIKDIEEKQKLLAWLRQRKEMLEKTDAERSDLWEETLPELYCCIYMAGNTLTAKSGEAKEHLRQWMEALPYVSVYYLGTGPDETVCAVGITEEERRKYSLEYLVPDFVLPASECICMNITTQHSRTFDTSEETIQTGCHRAENAGYALQGMFVIRVLDYIQKNGIYSSVNQFMFPLRK